MFEKVMKAIMKEQEKAIKKLQDNAKNLENDERIHVQKLAKRITDCTINKDVDGLMSLQIEVQNYLQKKNEEWHNQQE
jgi:hypothetical protein